MKIMMHIDDDEDEKAREEKQLDWAPVSEDCNVVILLAMCRSFYLIFLESH